MIDTSTSVDCLHRYIISSFVLMRNINSPANLNLHFRSETTQNSRVNDSFIRVHQAAPEESTNSFVKDLLELINRDEITST